MAFVDMDNGVATSAATSCIEKERRITLLFQVQDGPAPSAFAYRTADCAGVPTGVLQRAQTVRGWG